MCVDSSSCVQKGPDRTKPSQKRYRPRLRSRDKVNGRGHAILRLNAPWNRCAVAGSVSRRMPSKRGASERLVERALDALSRALTESGAPWMVIGGIAVIARGVRRFTTDIDAAVRGDAIRPATLLEVFRKHGIVPRIRDALSFADANLVLLLRHDKTGVDLDVSFAWSGFEHEALAGRTLADFGSVRVPMCTAADLVVFKAIASRPVDWADAEALLALYPDIDIARARRRVAELSALAEAPHVLEAFDALVLARKATKAKGSLRPVRRKSKKPRRRP